MEVFNDAEMHRVVALPRRAPMSRETAEQAAALLTQRLAVPGSKRAFNAKQGEALTEFLTHGKLFGALGPGAGKTDLTAVLPALTGARRTLLMVPAALRRKTIDSLTMLRNHWRGVPQPLDIGDRGDPKAPTLRVFAYESLSLVKYATFLEEYDPDLIVLDEAHFIALANTGRGRRFYRFIRAKRRRGDVVRVVPLTGTAWDRQLRRIAYLMEVAFNGESPLPCEYNALDQWGLALDQGVQAKDRIGFGALARICTPEQLAEGIDGVRKGVSKWVRETPGYVASKEVSCGLPLILQRRDITPPPEVITAMAHLRNDYVLPSGDSVEAGVTFWSHAREVANGFAYYFDPPPPAEWRMARSAWHSFVRETIRGSSSGGALDTPLQVWQAVEAGRFGVVPEHDAWVAIRDTYKPVSKPLWISDYLVRDAEAWAIENKGIVWVQHSTAHAELSEEDADAAVRGHFKQIPYFGAGDERIRTYKGPCAASVRAHGTGKDLVQWDEALLMGFPSSGKTIEQLLARHHREGQKSDIVRFWFYAHSLENLNAITTCLADAAHVQALSDMDQRILGAELLDVDGSAFDPEAYRERCEGPMWGADPDDA
jgi:hypothetical protein